MSKSGVFIVGAKRTAFGTFGGKLTKTTATDLGVVATKAALEHAGVKPKQVDHIIFGNVYGSSKCGIYLTRHIGLKAGIPEEVGALTVNRLCGSGFQSIVSAAQQIKSGDSSIVVAGGTENMSQFPFIVRGTRFGVPLGSKIEFEDSLWDSLTDPYAKMAMGQTAEKLGQKYGISRAQADEFGFRSQTLWKKANDEGIFKNEIAPMTVKGKKGEETFEVDEHPRLTSLEKMAHLKPVFGGVVTAGNASGVSDGAGAVVVAGEEAVKKNGLKPLARVVAYASVGVDPTIMGIGPAPAIRAVLAQSGLKMDDIDIFEVNEAFAPQALAVQMDLNIPTEKFNVCGGAIALGHPLAASGARISAHIVHELKRRNLKYGVGSACIGGGQGIAILFENVN